MPKHSINPFTDKKRIINLHICCKKKRCLFRAQTNSLGFGPLKTRNPKLETRNAMTRIYPRRFYNTLYLSRLLDLYLAHLATSPLQVHLRGLSYDTQIPESIFRRLMDLHRQPEDAPNLKAEDFHVLFSNVMCRYPTVKIWETEAGDIFFEM